MSVPLNSLPLSLTARRCVCNILGSLSRKCDPDTGRCQCKTGVVGHWCDRCNVTYWGLLTNDGCKRKEEKSCKNCSKWICSTFTAPFLSLSLSVRLWVSCSFNIDSLFCHFSVSKLMPIIFFFNNALGYDSPKSSLLFA